MDMKPGESAYMLPWDYDLKGGGIRPNAPISKTPKGPMCMPIKMHEGSKVEVDVNFDFFGKPYQFSK